MHTSDILGINLDTFHFNLPRASNFNKTATHIHAWRAFELLSQPDTCTITMRTPGVSPVNIPGYPQYLHAGKSLIITLEYKMYLFFKLLFYNKHNDTWRSPNHILLSSRLVLKIYVITIHTFPCYPNIYVYCISWQELIIWGSHLSASSFRVTTPLNTI